jgi:serine/threonine protein kinase
MKLNHENIVKLYGFYDDKDRIYLVLEYAPGGDLYGKLSSQSKKRFNEQ